MQLVLSCEHATNAVPNPYQELFLDAEEDLNSHKGWDPGALEITTELGEYFGIKPFIYPFTRLLIEPNRSLDHEQLFSDYSKNLPADLQEILISQYYLPYRYKVEAHIKQKIKPGKVLHLGIHTFTSIWNGVNRQVEIGVLFDPACIEEKKFGDLLVKKLKEKANGLSIRANEPYLGSDDGFTTYLRTKFDQKDYLGFEIEVSQLLAPRSQEVSELLENCLIEAMQDYQ